MEVININNLLERQENVAKMKDILTNFELLIFLFINIYYRLQIKLLMN